MEGKNKLYRLIKSMNTSEKRYFKVYASRNLHGAQSSYLQGFNAVNSQKKYNEEAIVKKFEGKKFVNQFSVTKNYLFNQIIRSLREYASTKNNEKVTYEQLNEIDILENKQLYKVALNKLRKLKKKCLKSEDFNKLGLLPQCLCNISFCYRTSRKML
jgi:hypothetical protein